MSLLGKHECKNLIREYFLSDNNSVMKEHDYADAFKEKFDIEFQSEEFGFNHNIYIEGSTCDYHNKYHNDKRN